MTPDKRAFEALLRAAINAAVYNGNVHGRGGVVSAEDRKFLADQEAAVLQAYDAAPGVRTAISMGRAIQNVVDRIERITQRRHDDETFTADVRWVRGLAKELAGHGSPPDAAAGREGEAVAWRHVMHMEGGQFMVRTTPNKHNPWGIQGKDFDSSYTVTSEPLFTHPAPGAEKEST